VNLCASKTESVRDGTCHGDFYRELGVAEDGDQGGDTGNDVGDHHSLILKISVLLLTLSVTLLLLLW